MSLKSFHIFFITLSTLLGLGFGVWAIREYTRTDEMSSLLLGIGSLLGCVAMLFYGRWFLRKMRDESWL